MSHQIYYILLHLDTIEITFTILPQQYHTSTNVFYYAISVQTGHLPT